MRTAADQLPTLLGRLGLVPGRGTLRADCAVAFERQAGLLRNDVTIANKTLSARRCTGGIRPYPVVLHAAFEPDFASFDESAFFYDDCTGFMPGNDKFCVLEFQKERVT